MKPTKYTFAIIPFKFNGDFRIFGQNAVNSGMWQEEDSDYSRMYKHIHDLITPENPQRSIIEYSLSLSPEKSVDLGFNVSDTVGYIFSGRNQIGEIYTERLFLPQMKMFIFETNIGFFTCKFVFDANIKFEPMCELTTLIKKMRFSQDNSRNKSLTMRTENEDKFLNLLEIIQQLVHDEDSDLHADLFFERSDVKKRVSAFMLSSFLFERELTEDDAAGYLKPLKRAQSKAHEVRFSREYEKPKILRPFKNMFWGFSSQGAANINYVVEGISNEDFIRSLNSTVQREYLFMTVFLLNQTYTLIDYCQIFSTLADKAVSDAELERMHKFRLNHVYNTVSNLEHYREYYRRLREALAVESLLEEVDSKQASLYRQKETQRNEQLKKIEDRIVAITAIVTVVLGVQGIISNLNSGYFLLEIISWKELVLWFLAASTILIILILLVIKIFNIWRHRNKSNQ